MTKQFTLIATALTLLAATGCHHNNAEAKAKPVLAHGEQFDCEDGPRATGRIAQSQAAAGAAADAMLYDRSFHGSKLNSLGQSKLDLIVKGTPTGDPVTVYLNMPKDAADARRPAVVAFLKTEGIKDGAMNLIDGPNPTENTPSAYNMAGMYKGKDNVLSGETAEDNTTAVTPVTPGK